MGKKTAGGHRGLFISSFASIESSWLSKLWFVGKIKKTPENYAVVPKDVKPYWILYHTVKYATWCSSCISFAQMHKLLDFSQSAQGIIQALQLSLSFSEFVGRVGYW